ncbi:hypothetical protein N7466_002986 [Penicillium verhagenii]|uniref:uncharacterized protein n=1 Tax=Penicillium verhagenii TaxID=1562060 RepID=UPI0025454A46|nr:uncharacterized protein N7466_002986 [Penicillium verhagenii]KAJ5936536.1 hypothetical protein N7466_002986 [Penicillium verhagenii]
MFKNTTYVNYPGNIFPASKHTERALKEHNLGSDQQTHTQVKPDTDLQNQRDPSGDEQASSHSYRTHTQIDNIITHDSKPMSRNATHDHDHDYIPLGDEVDDSTLPTVKQTLNGEYHALGGVANGQDDLLAMNGRRNNFEAISEDLVHDEAALTIIHPLHVNEHARGGCSAHQVAQSDETQSLIETLTGNNDHTHASLTMLATLQDQANVPIEGPMEFLRKHLNPDSHKLAYEVQKAQGAIQTEYSNGSNGEVTRDIGWHKAKIEIPDPLIGGYTNGELFAFIRRFNKDVFDVKAVPIDTASGLDLNDAWSQDHAGDKVALQLQRVYLSVVLGIASLAKQISRLRSWKETCRTSIFCGIYFAAWLFDLLMPLVFGTLILIVSSVQARQVLFPPAPRALVNIRTGGIQKPQAGMLGTIDTLTGAPEKQPHEATEEEASNFVENVRHNIQRAVGMHNNPQQDGDGDPLEGKIPKPMSKALGAVQSVGSAPGHITECTDQTQQPMEEIIWAGLNPESIAKVLDIAPHVIGELADDWERFANAISPRPPFSRFAFLRIVVVLASLFLVSLSVEYYIIYKGVGFIAGIAIFGDPMLARATAWLKRHVPDYMELAQPKNNILRGVPTNTQIAITLLRIGEAHKTPLPPVLTSNPDDPDHQNLIDAENIPVGATRPDVLDATMPSVGKAHGEGNKEKPKHRHLSNFVRFFKGNAKFFVEAKLAIDHVRAATGSQKAKDHLGVLHQTNSIIYTGPSEYQCRFEGKHGWAVITESPKPSVLFTRDDPRLMSSTNLKPVFEIAVEDIKRMKRATAFASSAVEAVVALSSDQKLLASLEIEDKEERSWRMTVMPERDELFNRLVAAGSQRWENM